MSSRPNILLITTDQQRWDSLGVYESPGYDTPVLNKLCKYGIYFDRTYCPSPVCTPARVSILTGQYPTRTGAYQIGMEPVPCLDSPNLASILADNGYSTAIIGKTHFVARTIESEHVAGLLDKTSPEELMFDVDFWNNFDGPYMGFEYVRHASGHTNCKPPTCHYRAWLANQGLNLDHQHWEWRDNKPVVGELQQGSWPIAEEYTQTAWITSELNDYIKLQSKNDDPWFCWASYQDPHPPFICPEPYFSEVDMTGVDLGGYKPGEFDDKPPFYKRFIEGKGWSDSDELDFAENGLNVPYIYEYDSVTDPHKAIKSYIGMVNMLDKYLGKVIDKLRKSGELENTLILFTTDHGEMLGRHGLWQKGVTAFDDCQRIPAVAYWPARQKQPVGKSDSMFNLVDIMPTFLEAAGIECPPLVQGVSQLSAITGEKAVVRDWALVDFLVSRKLHQQSLIHDEYKLVVYQHADYGELYNLGDDPDQYRNLYNEPEYWDIQVKMMKKLIKVNMECCGKMPQRIHSA